MPFGGKVLVLGGDFRQVLPVMHHVAREDSVGHSIKAHKLWRTGPVPVHSLATNMRARGDEEWREYLLKVGGGREPICGHISPFAIRVPDRILAPPGWTHTELAKHVFPGLAAAAKQRAQPNCPAELRQFWSDRAILTATNAMVDEVNAHILGELDQTTLET